MSLARLAPVVLLAIWWNRPIDAVAFAKPSRNRETKGGRATTAKSNPPTCERVVDLLIS